MKKGEIWTIAGGAEYAGKPRHAVIVQDDSFADTDSVAVCGFTSDNVPAAWIRLPVAPSEKNGLRSTSWIMVDKLTAISRAKLGYRVGALDGATVRRLNSAIVLFLGLGVP